MTEPTTQAGQDLLMFLRSHATIEKRLLRTAAEKSVEDAETLILAIERQAVAAWLRSEAGREAVARAHHPISTARRKRRADVLALLATDSEDPQTPTEAKE
jgi:hypothetical protein